jgi:uncharacterized membrane protein YhiD involved in acid resistance
MIEKIKKAFAWIGWGFAIIGAVIAWVFFGRQHSLSQQIELLSEERKIRQREIDETKRAYEEEQRKRETAEREYQDKLAQLEQQYKISLDELEKRKRDEIEKIIKESNDSPEELARKLADIIGADFEAKR